jgi:hypothetical protein
LRAPEYDLDAISQSAVPGIGYPVPLAITTIAVFILE